MNPLASLRTAWSIHRAPRFEPERLRRMQEQKLQRLIHHAWHHVPYYRRLLDGAGIDPARVRTKEDLRRVPITTRADLQNAGDDLLSSFYRREDLVAQQTSGSSGRPLVTWSDPHWTRARLLLFLRALVVAGYRPGQRGLMMKSRAGERVPRWSRWQTFSFDEEPERLLARLQRLRPRVLYGWVTPLRRLAEIALDGDAAVPGLRSVVTTAETLDASTRKLIEQALQAEVYDVYGLTEMGFVGWECEQHEGYHLSEDSAIVQLEPTAVSGGPCRMVMTNLELTSMPMIRCDSGDLGVPHDDARCACGRGFARVRRIEGRMLDCLRLEDGRVITPYQVTLALESVGGVQRYQVVQESLRRLVVRYEGEAGSEPVVVREARSLLGAIVGPQVEIAVKRSERLEPERGRKFRVVESRVGC